MTDILYKSLIVFEKFTRALKYFSAFLAIQVGVALVLFVTSLWISLNLFHSYELLGYVFSAFDAYADFWVLDLG